MGLGSPASCSSPSEAQGRPRLAEERETKASEEGLDPVSPLVSLGSWHQAGGSPPVSLGPFTLTALATWSGRAQSLPLSSLTP